MKNAIFTIVTGNYLPYADVLHDSIKKFNSNIDFFAFVVDSDCKNTSSWNFNIIHYNDIKTYKHARELREKYYIENNSNTYRWSSKPLIANYLLTKYEKILFCDPDLFFFNDYYFLLNYLNRSRFILSPHWMTFSVMNSNEFSSHMNHGLYNAGFFGANRMAANILEWWTTQNLNKCEKNTTNGLYDDQAYLNLIPIKFEKISIIKHRGINVANWNRLENKRIILSKDNGVLINGKYPIIFIHFNPYTIEAIKAGLDDNLRKYLYVYANKLSKHGIDIMKIIELTFLEKLISKVSHFAKRMFSISNNI